MGEFSEAFTAAGRMEGNRHYLSDVVMGAAVGLAVGSAVGLHEGPQVHEPPLVLTPAGAALVLRF